MSSFAEEWRRASATRTPLMDDSSSSSSGSASTIPNARSLNPRSFTSPNAVAAAQFPGDEYDSEDDLEIITSDLQPVPPTTKPTIKSESTNGHQASPSRSASSSRHQTAGGKRTMSDAAKARQSEIMKKRWASGGMDGVVEKRLETKKRKSILLGNGNSFDDDFPPSKKRTATTSNRSARASLNSYSPASISTQQQPDLSDHSPSQRALWAYIRPHLTVFKNKPIPKRCWVPELLALPRVRDLKWNPRRSAKRPFLDTDEKKVAALLLYLTGKAASQPCDQCSDGRGLFDGCVKLSDRAFLGANVSNCANCWSSHQSCRYQTGQPGGDTVVEDDSVLVYSEEEQEFEAEAEQEPEVGHITPELEERGGQLDPKTMPPILLTPYGREYNEWTDDNGYSTILTSGVLLPDDYRYGYTPVGDFDNHQSWLCPIDSCLRDFPTLKALGCHFPRVHYAQVLNDNLDGTFSILGIYDDPKLGNGGSYPKKPPSFPYVASQKAKGLVGLQRRLSKPYKLEKPQAVQSVETQDEDESEEQASVHLPAEEPSVAEPSVAEPRSEKPSSAAAMWEYIKPHLTKTTTIPDNGWVRELLPLPRVRDLQWNPHRSSDYYETVSRDISCLIIQVTGEEAPTPCTNCANGKGPFNGCVVISRNAPAEVRARIVSCANCNYHNGQSRCDLIDWTISREQPPYLGYRGRGAVAEPQDTATADKARVMDPTPPVNNMALDAATNEALLATAEPRPAARTSGPAGNRNVVEIMRPRPPVQRAESPPEASYLQPAPEPHLEMEDWEIAPGHVRYENPEKPDDLALSKNYLLGRPVRIHDDVQVQVETISSAQPRRFEPMESKLRSCFVAVGKLMVKIDGQPDVTVGEHGQFTIRPGFGVTLRNKLYSDVVLQITTVKVYD